MPHSFVSNNVHIVFSTRGRRALIPAGQQKRLWGYVAGITKNVGALPMAIGGMPDHVHVLAALPADLSIAKFVNVLKSNTSKWMRERGLEFGWQGGVCRVLRQHLEPGIRDRVHPEPGRAS